MLHGPFRSIKRARQVAKATRGGVIRFEEKFSRRGKFMVRVPPPNPLSLFDIGYRWSKREKLFVAASARKRSSKTVASRCSSRKLPVVPGGGPLTWFIETHNVFWKCVTPVTRKLMIPLNKQLRSHPLEVPLHPENRHMVGPLCTAVDYYAGWLVGKSLAGVLVRGGLGSRDGEQFMHFMHFLLIRLRKSFNRQYPIKDWNNARLLTRVFLIMAQMDSSFRTGRLDYIPSADGLARLNPIHSPVAEISSWFNERVPNTLVSECLAMVSRLADLLPVKQKCIYNPCFGAYGLVSGSDGDLFANKTLYEIKCLSSSSGGFEANHIRQLLGYCVLNKLCQMDLPIKKIALINPRRRFKWVENVEKVCSIIGARDLTTLTRAMKVELTRAS